MTAYGNSSDAYLGWPYRAVSSVLWAPLTVIGIVGNLMVILVVLTVRGMKTPTNCYLVSLAVADCLFFLSSTPVELSSIHLPEDVFLFGRIGCSILRFLPFLSMNASSLSITAFTIERYIGICHPMKARYICTVKRAQLIITIIWFCSIVYNSTWLFLTDLKPLNYTDWPDASQCTYSLNRASYKAVFLLDLFAFYWIPLLLYLILYGSMARIIAKARFFDSSSRTRHSPIASAKSSAAGTNGVNYVNEQGRILSIPSQATVSPRRINNISMKKSPSSLSSKAFATTKDQNSTKIDRNTIRGFRKTLSYSPSPLLTSTTGRNATMPPAAERRIIGHFKNGSDDENQSMKLTVESPSATKRKGRSNRDRSAPLRESKAYYGESLNKARVQVVKMLIVIVLVFALFWLPYRGLVVYNSFTQKPWLEKWYLLFAKTMVMVNCAINPILYNVMSGKFRCAFLLMFKRCFRRGSASNSSRFNSEMPSTLPPISAACGSNLHQFGATKRLLTSQTSNMAAKCKQTRLNSPRITENAKKYAPVTGIVSLLPTLISQSRDYEENEVMLDNNLHDGKQPQQPLQA